MKIAIDTDKLTEAGLTMWKAAKMFVRPLPDPTGVQTVFVHEPGDDAEVAVYVTDTMTWRERTEQFGIDGKHPSELTPEHLDKMEAVWCPRDAKRQWHIGPHHIKRLLSEPDHTEWWNRVAEEFLDWCKLAKVAPAVLTT